MYRGRPPPEPESESDWDSASEMASTARSKKHDTAPKIEMSSADERPSKNSTPKNANHRTTKPKAKEDRSLHLQVDNEVSSKASTPKTTRSQNNQPRKPDPLSTFTFNDRSQQNDDEDFSITEKKSRKDAPPYDFKPALTGDDNSVSQRAVKPPGKDRKGNRYDPVTPAQDPDSADEVDELDSWDDTEVEKSKREPPKQSTYSPAPPATQRSEVKAADGNELQTSGSSWRNARLLGNKKGPSKDSPKEPAASMSTEQLLGEPEESADKHTHKMLAKPKVKMDFSQHTSSLDVSRYVYPYEEGRQEYSEAHRDRTNAKMTEIANKAEIFLTRMWQEVFAVLRLVMLVVTTFVIQLVKFVTRDIFQTMVVGLLVVIGDHVIKPLFSALYNGFLQPSLVLLWNILHGVKNAFQPLFLILRGIFQQVAVMLSAFRLVEVNWKNNVDQQQLAIQEV